MSQENIEIVRRGWEAWVQGDLDALLELCDPAVEWDTTHMEGWPEDAVYSGRDGVRRFLEEWLGSWERFESGAEKILEAGGDRVVVICWQQGFGPGSEVPVHMDWAQICTLQHGLVSRVEAYSDRAQALEAAGLREEMSQENVEVVRAFFEAAQRDPEQAAQTFFAPDLEFNPFSHPDGPAQGPGGFMERLEELAGQFETYDVRPDRLEQVGELVIADIHREARSRRGPALIRDRFSQVLALQDGKIVRIDSFPTFGEALRAARLRE